MKIELKKISFNERMSDETNCFIADLYINGKRVGSCENDGHGGCTNYRGDTNSDCELITKAEKYCKSLPKVKYHDMEWEQSLEGAIDELLEKYLKEKQHKKMEKLFNIAIVMGVPNGNEYRYMKYKRPLSEVPTMLLQKAVENAREKFCKNGVVILNTNFGELGIE
jgi:hypothetical protein